MRTTAVNMLDMSFCRVDPHGGLKLCQDFILHGLVQLNLSENRLEEKVGAFSVDQLRHFSVFDRIYIQVYPL